MNELDKIFEKLLSEMTEIETAIWYTAGATTAYDMEKAAAELARITAERNAAMKLLARADVAFRCDLSQPEANDYYWRTREDIAAALKQSS